MGVPYTVGPLLPRRPRAVRLPVRRHRRKPSATEAATLRLVSAGTAVPIRLATESPTLMVLAVEDLCWQLAVADHAGRRPVWWRRAKRDAWTEEEARWEAKRERLAAMAREAISTL